MCTGLLVKPNIIFFNLKRFFFFTKLGQHVACRGSAVWQDWSYGVPDRKIVCSLIIMYKANFSLNVTCPFKSQSGSQDKKTVGQIKQQNSTCSRELFGNTEGKGKYKIEKKKRTDNG